MRFCDRADAERQLAAALVKYRGQRPLVLAIPRGAVGQFYREFDQVSDAEAIAALQ